MGNFTPTILGLFISSNVDILNYSASMFILLFNPVKTLPGPISIKKSKFNVDAS